MPAPVSSEVAGTTYRHTPEQHQRAAALRRFNWLFVYAPIIVLSLAALILVILLLWGVLSPDTAATRAFASGLADIIVILLSLPLLILCAVGPAGLIAMIVLAVRRRRDPQAASILERLHRLLWRLDNVVERVLLRTKELAPRMARPVINLHARSAYLRTLTNRLKRILTRS